MEQALVIIGDNQWNVDVAISSAELAQGLSGLESIPALTGMLFDLGTERTVTVNAYDMLFPISIIFINEDLIVNDVELSLSPGEDYTSFLPCRYFLEVNRGEAANVAADDTVVIDGYPSVPESSIISSMVTMMIVVMMMKMMMGIMTEVK